MIYNTYEGSKSHHESNEEPNPGPKWSQTTLSEALSSEKTVRDGIDHQHRDGGEDPAQVKIVPGVVMVTAGGVQGEPPSREEKSSSKHGCQLVSFLTPVNILKDKVVLENIDIEIDKEV